MPPQLVSETVAHVRSQILLSGFGVILVGAFVGYLLIRRFTRPLEEMRRGVERFARGDFNLKLAASDTLELGSLAESMNEMARQLDERIRTVVEQQNEQQAVLSSMVEGVIAVDLQERIIHMNGSARAMLGIGDDEAQGRSIQEVIRNSELHKLVQEILQKKESGKREIVLSSTSTIYLKVYGAALRNVGREAIGAVVVFHDVTDLRRLERIRRDFVANVSHELRTPITSIKGFVETLLDGAIESGTDAKRFLEIIRRHTDRLDGIVHDLLKLARIEQSGEERTLETAETNIKEVLAPVREYFEMRAKEKGLELEIDCTQDFNLKINRSLVEQAVLNLVDNAIKYSEVGGKVAVRAAQKPSENVISVVDRGVGIAEEDIARVFERFYRVDKSRTRSGVKEGGTGLGLSIVKHVAIAHGGEVRVESRLGEGSVFSIHLPREKVEV